MFKPKIPHFFKVIIENVDGQGKLGIPVRFIRKYGNELPNPVFFRVPSGTVWEVELVKSNGEMWFQNGWQKFKEYYSVTHGYFLVFEYHGEGLFHVVIFDTSATEIDYRFGENGIGRPNLEGESERPGSGRNGDDHVVEEISKKRQKSPLPCPRPSKTMRTGLTDKSGSTSKLDSSVPKTCTPPVCIKAEASTEEDMNLPCSEQQATRASRKKENRRTNVSTADEKTKALNRASSAFKSKNPYFKVSMRPSHVDPGRKINLPSRFARTHFKEQHSKVILCVSDGEKTWSVKFYRSSGKASFCNGWRNFVVENSVKVGDVCVFELIKRTKITFKVFVERVGHDSNNLPSQGEDARSKANIHKTRNNLNEFPPQKKIEISTPLRISPPKKMCRNNLSSGAGRTSEIKESNIVSPQMKERALKRAAAFKPKNPHFVVQMQRSYLKEKLNIPFKFANAYFKAKQGKVILRNSEGGAWTVDYGISSAVSKAQFYSSWSLFSQGNKLKIGDACVFEFIKHTELQLKVEIFRASNEEHSPSRKQQKLPLEQTCSNKATRTTEFESISKLHSSVPPSGFTSSRLKLESSTGNLNQSSHIQFEGNKKKVNVRRKPLTANEKAKALDRASAAFKSEKPLFMIPIQPSYIRSKSGLGIPIKFSRRYFKEEEGEVVLHDLERRVWKVLYRVHKNNQAHFDGSWGAFSRDNYLEVGDVCIFEMINGAELTFRVRISRAVDHKLNLASGSTQGSRGNRMEMDCCMGTKTESGFNPEETRPVIRSPSGGKSAGRQIVERPSCSGMLEAASELTFKVAIGSRHLLKGIFVPGKIMKLIKQRTQIVSLKIADRSWPVRLNIYPCNRGELSGGWRAFAKDNSLRVGDDCVFELINRKNLKFKVSIFRLKPELK